MDMVLSGQEQRAIKDTPGYSPRVLFSAEVTGAGHSAGYYTLLRAFREAGMEVVDGGFQTSRTIAHIARDEDVDVVAFRIMDGDPVILVEQLLSVLEEVGRSDIALVVGGIVTPTAAVRLRELGVTGVFGPGTPLTTIISHIRNLRFPYPRSPGG
jgi:methylmalonyl-CoA mutase C-terminal domain/subunit